MQSAHYAKCKCCKVNMLLITHVAKRMCCKVHVLKEVDKQYTSRLTLFILHIASNTLHLTYCINISNLNSRNLLNLYSKNLSIDLKSVQISIGEISENLKIREESCGKGWSKPSCLALSYALTPVFDASWQLAWFLIRIIGSFDNCLSLPVLLFTIENSWACWFEWHRLLVFQPQPVLHHLDKFPIRASLQAKLLLRQRNVMRAVEPRQH